MEPTDPKLTTALLIIYTRLINFDDLVYGVKISQTTLCAFEFIQLEVDILNKKWMLGLQCA